MENCRLCVDLSDDDKRTLVLTTDLWRVLVAPNQSLLGRCYVTLQRHAESIADLTSAEVTDWHLIARRLEHAIKQTFPVAMFNWQCNMNFAYRQQPANSHVHWHLLPRYPHPVNEFGMTFVDPHFGSLYQARSQELPIEVLEMIAERIVRFC